MKPSVYLKLQLKRAFKLFPSILLVTVLTVSSIAVAGAVLLSRNATSENVKKIQIGVVGDMQDSYLGIGMYALQNIDSSRFFVEFKQMEEDAARQALQAREISGYVLIPDDFVAGILNGSNRPVRYITLNNPVGFGTILMNEVTKIVSDLVTESQKGIYSMQKVALDYDVYDNIGAKTRKLNLSYIEFILGRSRSYELELLGVSDALSMGGYYICGILTFFMLIWGISCNRLLADKKLSLSRSLRVRGMKTPLQLLGEYAGFLAVTLVMLVLLAAVFGTVVDANDFGIGELKSADVFSCIGFIFKILPAIVMFTMLHMMLYEIFTGTVSAVLVQFLIAVGLGYISGCFYPDSFFPEAVQRFAAALPSGVGFSFIRKMLSGMPLAGEGGLIAFYTLLFAAITVYVRERRITGASL